MDRVYFEGWFHGCYAKAEDWYKDDLVYISIKLYYSSTRVNHPDEEKAFLIRFSDKDRIRNYSDTIVLNLIIAAEKRDKSGCLIPIDCTLPALDLLKGEIA